MIADLVLQDNERMAEISREIGLDAALARLGVTESEKTLHTSDSRTDMDEKKMVDTVEG